MVEMLNSSRLRLKTCDDAFLPTQKKRKEKILENLIWKILQAFQKILNCELKV